MTGIRFDRALTKEVRPRVSALGFTHLRGTYFDRVAGPWRHVFVCGPLRYTPTTFTAVIGVAVTDVESRLAEPRAGKGPHFVMSRHLGSRRPGASDFQTFYPYGSLEQLRQSAADLAEDIATVAVPWFESFRSPSDLAERYYSEVIAPRMKSGYRLPAAEELYAAIQLWANGPLSTGEPPR